MLVVLQEGPMKQFELPTAPASQSGPVKAWCQPVVIPTYLPLRPDKNPMFLEKRVYQGSSGRVYPLPFTDRISSEAREHSWQALHIENKFVHVYEDAPADFREHPRRHGQNKWLRLLLPPECDQARTCRPRRAMDFRGRRVQLGP